MDACLWCACMFVPTSTYSPRLARARTHTHSRFAALYRAHFTSASTNSCSRRTRDRFKSNQFISCGREITREITRDLLQISRSNPSCLWSDYQAWYLSTFHRALLNRLVVLDSLAIYLTQKAFLGFRPTEFGVSPLSFRKHR